MDYGNEIFAFFRGVDFALKFELCVRWIKTGTLRILASSIVALLKCEIEFHNIKALLGMAQAGQGLCSELSASAARRGFCEVTMEWKAWVMCHYCIFCVKLLHQ